MHHLLLQFRRWGRLYDSTMQTHFPPLMRRDLAVKKPDVSRVQA